jgi:hypothetical protein
MQWPGGGESVTEQTDHFVGAFFVGKIGKPVSLRNRAPDPNQLSSLPFPVAFDAVRVTVVSPTPHTE